ncbi:MAG: GNAT family N-acetyltransferase [Ktedonobacteraceae bacterium]|nr:GNAT family N-acetyltransferase [Ktedonobacteraceae bacterium]
MPAQEKNIQIYNEQRDLQAVYDLWQTVLGATWPIEYTRFRQVLAGSAGSPCPQVQHFVARESGQVTGFAATFTSKRGKGLVGHLAALLVDPQQQHKGIGSALHTVALDHLRSSGTSQLHLGGISPRFWCGLPMNLAAALPFFTKRGWEFSEHVFDLVQDLRHYITPEKTWQRMEREHITFETASKKEIGDILAFEAREFPNWVRHFERCAALDDYDDILVARDHLRRVVGTLIMYSPRSHPERTDVIWQSLLGQNAGAMGVVGVAATERGRGIGIALVARASEILKERGVGNCYIDWVELTDFYARLGYGIWREYALSWRRP